MLQGLLAAGECASASVHGANRLGANSLLDIVVFGRACAKRVESIVKPGTPFPELKADAGDYAIGRVDTFRYADGSTTTAEARIQMQKIMQVGVICLPYRLDTVLEEYGYSWCRALDLLCEL